MISTNGVRVIYIIICPVVVGPFRDFSPKFKKKIFFEVFRCFVSLFRGLEMPLFRLLSGNHYSCWLRNINKQ